jgi:hypothetical protein
MKIIKNILIIATLMLGLLPLMAQEKRMSPHETVSAVVGGNRVTIVYGRPYTTKPGTTEARKIWGGLVPYGKVWRVGADEATLLITQKPLAIGDTTVPAGVYTLFMLPNEDGTAKLILNKQIGQWGEEYDESQDLARVDLTKRTLDTPVNQFTVSVGKGDAGAGVIKLSWENAEYSAKYTVAK